MVWPRKAPGQIRLWQQRCWDELLWLGKREDSFMGAQELQ